MKAKPVLAIDAETDPFRFGRVPRDFAWGLYDGSECRIWWENPQAFTRQLFSRRAYAYAHNGGSFDFHLLAPYLPSGTRLGVTRYGITQAWPGEVELRDSWPLFRVGLREHYKREIDYAKHEREAREDYRQEICEYLRTDCVSLWELVTRFRAEYGHRAVTIGQAALAELRRLEHLKTARTEFQWDSTFRPFFFGGRCEALRRGSYSQRFKVWDISSAYPAAMLGEHPWGHRYTVLDRMPDDPSRLARCFVHCTARGTGLLPRRHGQATTYPDDERIHEYHATGHELVAGAETGHLRLERVLAVYEFPQSRDFSRFVGHFWGRRQLARKSSDKASEIIAKSFLNAAFGKLAQNATAHRDHQLIPETDYWRTYARQGWHSLGRLGPHQVIARPRRALYPPYLHIACAASITGAVRARLWRAWQGSEGVLYLDTDSLACRRLDPRETVGPGLGQWRPLGEFTHAAIGGKKLYAFRYLDPPVAGKLHKTASKGVRLSASEIERICRGEVVEWVSDAPTFRLGGPAGFARRKIQIPRRS